MMINTAYAIREEIANRKDLTIDDFKALAAKYDVYMIYQINSNGEFIGGSDKWAYILISIYLTSVMIIEA